MLRVYLLSDFEVDLYFWVVWYIFMSSSVTQMASHHHHFFCHSTVSSVTEASAWSYLLASRCVVLIFKLRATHPLNLVGLINWNPFKKQKPDQSPTNLAAWRIIKNETSAARLMKWKYESIIWNIVLAFLVHILLFDNHMLRNIAVSNREFFRHIHS